MVMRVFTGAMVPPGADAVIPREQLLEVVDQIVLSTERGVRTGQHIRRRGENGMPGQPLAGPGCTITPPMLAAAASCGKTALRVHRRVRVGIIVTGGEILAGADSPQSWQLRDANGPALFGMFASSTWIDPWPAVLVQDNPNVITHAVTDILSNCDALLITGGVSAGDYDYVPVVLCNLGLTTVFHHLAIRPGRPVLGAVDLLGRPILALPGNPVAVLVTARRLAAAALRRRAGLIDIRPAEFVEVDDATAAPATLTWFPLVRHTAPGRVALVPGMSSGDWVSAAVSDGFIEVPPGESAHGSRHMYRWTLTD
jgi:molybdopterin molybdotransferase